MNYFDLIIEFIKGLSPEYWLLIVSLFGNLLFGIFKLKGSRLEKDYKKAIKSCVSTDYYCKLRGKYYLIDELHFVSKDSISDEEYKINKG